MRGWHRAAGKAYCCVLPFYDIGCRGFSNFRRSHQKIILTTQNSSTLLELWKKYHVKRGRIAVQIRITVQVLYPKNSKKHLMRRNSLPIFLHCVIGWNSQSFFFSPSRPDRTARTFAHHINQYPPHDDPMSENFQTEAAREVSCSVSSPRQNPTPD